MERLPIAEEPIRSRLNWLPVVFCTVFSIWFFLPIREFGANHILISAAGFIFVVGTAVVASLLCLKFTRFPHWGVVFLASWIMSMVLLIVVILLLVSSAGI